LRPGVTIDKEILGIGKLVDKGKLLIKKFFDFGLTNSSTVYTRRKLTTIVGVNHPVLKASLLKVPQASFSPFLFK